MATDLEELEVLEVSLVEKPANRKKFCLYKSDGGKPKMRDLTAAILSVPDDPESLSQIEKRSGLSKEANAVLGDAVKMLTAIKDEMSAGLMKQISDALGVRGLKAEEEEEEEDAAKELPPEEDKEEEEEAAKELPTEEEDEDKEEAAKELPTEEEDEDEEEKLMSRKTENKDNEKLYKSQNATPELKALWKAHEDLKAKYEGELADKKKTLFITKAEKELVGVPGMTPAAAGKLLNNIDDLSPKLAQQVEAVLKSAVTVAESAGVFGEIGSAQPSPFAGDNPQGKIEGLARDRVTKTGEDYTTAYVKVLEENPSLYTNYLKGGR